MKLAILGDLHLGRSLFGHSLTPHIQRCMWDFFELCEDQGVDVAVQVGDVFDTPNPSEEHRKLAAQWCNEFEREGINLFILVGNHDATNNRAAPSALQYLKTSPYSNVWVVDRPLLVTPDCLGGTDVNLLFLPFPSAGIYKSAKRYRKESLLALDTRFPDYPTVSFAHLNVDGAKLGDQEFVYRGADHTIAKRIVRECSLSICGHIHKPQRCKGINIIGSAERLRFDEVNQSRCFMLAEVDFDGVASFKHCLRTNAISLVQIKLDLTTDGLQSTPDAITYTDQFEVENAIIKVVPTVDVESVVDLYEVQKSLVARGAEFVHVAPPIKAAEQKTELPEYVRGNPTDEAFEFIQERVTDQDEASLLMKQFETTLRENEQ